VTGFLATCGLANPRAESERRGYHGWVDLPKTRHVRDGMWLPEPGRCLLPLACLWVVAIHPGCGGGSAGSDGAADGAAEDASLPVAQEAGAGDVAAADQVADVPAPGVDSPLALDADIPRDTAAPLDAAPDVAPLDAVMDRATADGAGQADAPWALPDLAGLDLPAAAVSGFVLAPAGVFLMGSPAGEDQAQSNEQPSHPVSITRPFLISDHEVTQREWREVMGDAPSYHKDCGDDCPVESITWYAALAFANALSDRAGLPRCHALETCGEPIDAALVCAGATFAGPACLGYRLPTEAEWEYAARAGTTTPTQHAEPIDDWWICRTEDASGTYTNPLLTFCHYVCSEGGGPTQVRSLLPNGWGLYDMAGNVAEWVWDVYGPYGADAAIDPLGPASGAKRVTRSASSSYYGPDCRNARRDSLEPDWRSTGLGLRVVRTLP
jgi:formylglycine-generating enzyme required for sulfatase activity